MDFYNDHYEHSVSSQMQPVSQNFTQLIIYSDQ